MRKILFVLLLSPFILASCNSSEAVNVKSNRVTQSDSGYLVSKTPIELDGKFGYKVTVAKADNEKSEGHNEKVFISKKFYDEIPDPKDNLKVKIYFLKEIPYGKDTKEGISWDIQCNVGYHYEVEK